MKKDKKQLKLEAITNRLIKAMKLKGARSSQESSLRGGESTLPKVTYIKKRIKRIYVDKPSIVDSPSKES